MPNKVCTECRKSKPFNEFYDSKGNLDGKRGKCKECMKHDGKVYRANNLDACRARGRVHNTSLLHKYRNYQYNAKRRDIKFFLTREQVEIITSQPCFYCGSNKSVGIDRVDNNIGYLVENCVPCCMICNKMKINYSLEDFLNHIINIYKKSCNGVGKYGKT